MYLIVGAGLSGAVIAEKITTILKEKVILIEKRPHIAGNCYDYKDTTTNILMNEYGAHLFHTNSEIVWNYIQSFAQWVPWHHKVLSYVDNKIVPVPVNLTTVSELCNKHFQDKKEFQEYLKSIQIKPDGNSPKNSEEMALSRVGKELYEKMFKPYTYKQWNKYPEELDPLVLARIPIRDDCDPRYFTDKYQALPKEGYTNFVKNLLNNPLITVYLNTDFEEYKKQTDLTQFKKIIYTGPIDEYFRGNELDKLEYRSIHFTKKILPNTNYFQTNSVINYPELKYPFTRIVEYKHFLNQESNDTVIVYEETTSKGEPYYPVPTERNKLLYERYRQLAENEEKEKEVLFVGRLANYKYFNMDEAIMNALTVFEDKIKLS